MVIDIITLTYVVALLEQIDSGLVGDNVRFISSFWYVFALLFGEGIVSWIGTIVVAILAILTGMANESVTQVIIFPAVALFGFIPVFIYGIRLGAQLST